VVRRTSGTTDSNGATQESKKSRDGRQELGRTGERLAAGALVKHGYRVLEHNFRCRYGEIDIVAEEGADLVFVEVKTRRGQSHGLPEEAVTWRKARKLAEVATCYLDQHACSERAWRIDVVAVQLSSDGKMQEIRIYQHAVTES
jgi:putative endonuclease